MAAFVRHATRFSSRSRSAGDRGDRRARFHRWSATSPRVVAVARRCPPVAAGCPPTPCPARLARAGARKWPRVAARKAGVRRRVHHRARRPRGGPQAPRYVHRLHRRARPAPPGLGGRRQRRRRGAGRLLRHHRRGPAGRRRRPGHRQRPWLPGRPAPEAEEAGRRGRADRAARGRQVRRQGVRGLRRSARRRRLRGQRAVHQDGRGDPQVRQRLAAALHRLQARPAGEGRDHRPRPARRSQFWPDPTIFETVEFDFADDLPAAPGDGVPQPRPDHPPASTSGPSTATRTASRARSPSATRAASPTSSGTSTTPRPRSTSR